MYNSIVVPTDGSEHARRAADHAAYLSEAFDATLHLLHVVDIDAEAGPFSAGGVGDQFLERLEERGRETVEELAGAISAGSEVRTSVATDRPSRAILDYVDAHDTDLVCMGTHGRTGVRRYVMGSVAERVVSLADVPVMTATATEGSAPIEGYEDVLIPTDGTAGAEAAIEHGLAVAGIAGGTIHAVNVVHTSKWISSEIAVPPDVAADLEAAGENATETVADRARGAGLDAVTDVRSGTPADTLLAYAEETDIDLIAMGTTGRTGLSGHLLGSTAERVIRHVPVPVLAVNARNRTTES